MRKHAVSASNHYFAGKKYTWTNTTSVLCWHYSSVSPIPVAQTVKNLTAMQETRVRSLGQEDPLEKGMASHSSILAWRIPWTEEPVGLQSLGLLRVGHNWVTNTHMIRFILKKHIVMTLIWFSSVQFSSVAQSCPTLCDPMNHSTPGLPVYHQLPEFTQTHVHWVSDAIQSSHPLSSPSPPAPNPSQHQSFPMSQLFAWGGQSTGVSALASFLPNQAQGWSPSEWTICISLQSKGLSRVFSNTTVQKHQFFGDKPSSQSKSHIHTWPQEKS